jgi:hypothetical protein
VEGKLEMYKASYKLLQQKVKDSTLLSGFAFVYNLEMGNRYNNQRFESYFRFFKSVRTIYPHYGIAVFDYGKLFPAFLSFNLKVACKLVA